MIWWDMIWCDVNRYDMMIWYDMIIYGVNLCSMIWSDLVLNDINDMIWSSMI